MEKGKENQIWQAVKTIIIGFGYLSATELEEMRRNLDLLYSTKSRPCRPVSVAFHCQDRSRCNVNSGSSMLKNSWPHFRNSMGQLCHVCEINFMSAFICDGCLDAAEDDECVPHYNKYQIHC